MAQEELRKKNPDNNQKEPFVEWDGRVHSHLKFRLCQKGFCLMFGFSKSTWNLSKKTVKLGGTGLNSIATAGAAVQEHGNKVRLHHRSW